MQCCNQPRRFKKQMQRNRALKPPWNRAIMKAILCKPDKMQRALGSIWTHVWMKCKSHWWLRWFAAVLRWNSKFIETTSNPIAKKQANDNDASHRNQILPIPSRELTETTLSTPLALVAALWAGQTDVLAMLELVLMADPAGMRKKCNLRSQQVIETIKQPMEIIK